MKHSFNHNRTQLIIEIDNEEREIIKEYGEEMHSDAKMWEFFEPYLINKEIHWILPEEMGDLTDAPMLGVSEYDDGANSGEGDYIIWERWAYMDYQVKSVLEELYNNGRVVFVC